MIERDLVWAAHHRGRVERSRVIAAPGGDVWTVVADHAGWCRWFPGIGAIVRPLDAVDAVGGRRTVRTGPVRLDERFLAWEPERRFAFTGTAMTPPALRSIVEDIRLEPHGAHGTTVSYTIAIEPAGPIRASIRVAQPLIARFLERGLAGLARAAEARAVTPGP